MIDRWVPVVIAVTPAFELSALAPMNRAPTTVAGRVATEMDETLILATHHLEVGSQMVKAVTLITASPGKVDAVASGVKAIQGVNDVLTVAGRADVAAMSEGSSEDISRIMRKIEEVEGVQTTETLLEVA